MPDIEYRSFLELLPDAVVIINDEGIVEYFNAQAEYIWMLQRTEIVGKSVDLLLPERFRAAHSAHRGKYLNDPRRRPMGEGLELFGLRSNGREFAVDVSLGPIMSAHGVRYVAIVRDVSQQVSAVAAIRRTIDLTQGWMQQLAEQLARLG